MASGEMSKVSVTLITGFLGSGKTTLLNRILAENHGKKLAIVENEFGEVGIDDELVKQKIRLEGTDENNICMEMNNGCICCTVRADMAKTLNGLLERHRSGNHLDGIIIETTGVADPGPVVQTLFVDEGLTDGIFLDGILTVVDAKHIGKHLDEKEGDEATHQVAYADRILLNKIDLVSPEELDAVEDRISSINGTARIIRTTHAKVDMDVLLGINAFKLERITTMDPDFLALDEHEHEHDEHCTDSTCTHEDHHHGHSEHKHDEKHDHKHGEKHDHKHDEKHDHKHDEKHDHKHGEKHDHKHDEKHDHKHDEKHDHKHGEKHDHKHDEKHDHKHDEKHDHKHGEKHDHKHDEKHDHKHNEKHNHKHNEKHNHKHGHSHKKHKHRHDALVTSVGLVEKGSLDYDVLSHWITQYLMKHGNEKIYRVKGVLNIADEDDAFVLQGVHQVWNMMASGPWPKNSPRRSKMIFIGKDLDREYLKTSFRGCVEGTEEHKKARKELEEVWDAEEEERQNQLVLQERAMRKEFDVSIHNGMYGLGLLLKEETGMSGQPEVRVAGFAPMAPGVVNNARQTGMIAPGDVLIAINGTPVTGLPLRNVVSILRRFPRGQGAAGTTINFTMRMGLAAPINYNNQNDNSSGTKRKSSEISAASGKEETKRRRVA
eukprot:g4473.t1